MLELSKQKILNKNKVLCEKYPFLVPRWGYDEKTPDDYDYSYTWLDSLPVGWRTLAIMMCEELREELIRCNFLNEYMIIEAKEKFGCYDKDTEVLTKRGWKFFKDVNYDDEIATLNPTSNTLEYKHPINIMTYDYCGNMYHFENRGVSLLVTPNHMLYIAKGSYVDWKHNNKKRMYSFEFARPEKYFRKDKRFLKTCSWTAKKPDNVFHIEGYSYIDTINRKRVLKNLDIDMLSFVRFLGYYIAEGCSNYKKGEITISRDRSDYKKDIVEKLILDIGFTPYDGTDYKRNDNSGSTKLYNKVLAKWLIDNCGHLAPNKKVPDFIKQLPSEYIIEFLNYLYLGDGHKNKTSNILYTTSKQLSDDVQELLLKAGYTSRCTNRGIRKNLNNNKHNINQKHECYEINWLKLKDIEVDMSKARKTKSFIEEWVEYNDKVYCLTVPNHVMYIRRNGKCVWCGNSVRIYDNGIPHGCKAWDIIEKYAVLSYNVCCVCGKPDVPTSEGWICPFCKDCYDENYNSTITWETLHKEQSPHIMGKYYAEKCKDKDFAEEILETAEKYREQWEMERKANANGFQKFK